MKIDIETKFNNGDTVWAVGDGDFNGITARPVRAGKYIELYKLTVYDIRLDIRSIRAMYPDGKVHVWYSFNDFREYCDGLPWFDENRIDNINDHYNLQLFSTEEAAIRFFEIKNKR